MAYTNSSLVNYKKISPYKTVNRNHKIDTITIHCIVGQIKVENLANVFQPGSGRRASSNYGVGLDGRIGMYVEEKDRAWTSSNSANDNRAVTIEVACDTYYPYNVNAKAYDALIKLCADICKRNGIKSLKWKADKSLIGKVNEQNMTVHRWFSATDCPGEYLYSHMGDIAKAVNNIIDPKEPIKNNAVSTSASKFLPSRGYFKPGDNSANVGKIASFMRKAFPSYTSQAALGNYFGPNLTKSIKEFQKRTGLEPDGCIGPKTLNMLKKYGFKE